jgi:Ca-activated chloride channel homolog
MKRNFSFPALLLLLGAMLFLGACKKGPIDPYHRQLIFFGEYSKPAATPSFQVDMSTLPRQIQIPANQTPISGNCPAGRVCMSITNVRLKDELGIYDISAATDVVTQEKRSDGTWEQDVENKLTLNKTQSLDIVLVLDYSSSLGNDITKVKEYATTFINYIKTNNPGAKVGVVTFSNAVQSLSLTSNYTTATSFIATQPSGADETRLYEAMDKGISLFQGSAAEGKAIVTFTDGKNNSWSNTVFQNYDQVKTKLSTPIGNPASLVTSYTIGLNGKQGGVDASALNALAMNGGTSDVAPDTEELSKIFKKFASSVSAVYTMTYNRNSSVISTPIKLRFVVNTQLQ